MKSLADCKPREFLKQTNRIRKSLERWLEVTDIMNLRGKVPEYEPLPQGATREEIEAAQEAYKEKVAAASKESMKKILDAILDKHPDETLELLALACFVEPKDVDNYTVSEYLQTLNSLLNNATVIDFFTSLLRLAQNGTFKR